METVTDTPKSDGDTIINFYSGASNIDLASKLADHIETTFKGEVFQSVHIITPNKAQHNWLKEQLAENLGFIGNLKQHSFNSFFRELIENLDPNFKEKPSGEKLIWKLFTEMGKTEFQNKFENIKNYCGEDEVKRLALAQKVAGLFDSYQEFDPAEEWKSQDHPDLEWQKYLYEQCGYSTNQMSPEKLEEFIRLKPEILKKYHSLYICGNVSLSPLYLQYLKILKEQKGFSIYLYRTNLNLKRKNNPLTQNWGELAVKTNEQLEEIGTIPEMDFPSEGGNLLNQIQRDICSDSISDKLVADDSVLIYNSFTRVREIEALYNYLVKTVDESKEKLGARDIMVCISNLDPYISAIRTVFDSAPYEFPYTLVTKGYGREESFWTALEQVLAFEEENFTAPGVFNLLEMQPVQKAFGFTDLDLLKKAFIDANIRREYEGDKDLETNFSSFSNGLERLIYGFCLGSEEPVVINGKKIYPVDIAEGQQAQDLFRLHHLVQLLQEFLTLKETPKTAGAWHIELMRITEEFLQPEDWQQNQFSELMEELGSMEDSSEEVIGFNTFFFRLKDQLQNKDLQQIKGIGGIVFSGLYPGMSMPKKVIAFLGLNFGEFPRKSQELSFDLLPEDKKLSSRIKDRGAFLETFLNAGNRVLLSYIGQDVKNNSKIPSSAIVSELEEYSKKAGAVIKQIKHPLHSFNSGYFDSEKKDLFTFTANKKEKLTLDYNSDRIKEVPDNVPLHILEIFLRDPFKHHYNKVLEIYFENPEILPEWELFEIGTLENWALKDFFLKKKLDGLELNNDLISEARKEMIVKSALPLKVPGEMKLEEVTEEIETLWTELNKHTNNQEHHNLNFELDFNVGNKVLKLTGELNMFGEDSYYLFVSKAEKKKYELSAYLRLLIMKAMGLDGGVHYCCFEKEGDGIFYTKLNKPVSKNEAIQELRELLQLYVQNYRGIVSFYPEFNFEVSEILELSGKPEEEKAILMKEMIDEKVDAYLGFYPSDYFIREYRQGFFEGDKSVSRLNELQKLYSRIFGAVDIAFGRKNQSNE
ncbi:exodeoxyribonuclease V subunit gamma [Gillisia sp. Q332]|uniref:exodeoxyribonuclease V subunit gamma n=1 Tax=Gillisia xinjiangensis TaxID=3384765 RepID=UPI003918D85E